MSLTQQVLGQLAKIEQEMKRIGYWDSSLDENAIRESAVSFATERGQSPVGNMKFEHWLQAVFIPNARAAAKSNSLPSDSDVSVMAMREYDYHSHFAEAENLLALLQDFDKLIKRGG